MDAYTREHIRGLEEASRKKREETARRLARYDEAIRLLEDAKDALPVQGKKHWVGVLERIKRFLAAEGKVAG